MTTYPFQPDYLNELTEPQVLTFKEFNDLIKEMSNNNSRTTSGTQTAFEFARSSSPKYMLSNIEAAILRSSSPIKIKEGEEIEVNGQRGIWANKIEQMNWSGDIPLKDYQINQDNHPEIIKKTFKRHLEYVQELAIRYLKPPTPPTPGEIIIKFEPNTQIPPAPPLIIRQAPPRPVSPVPLVIREEPPKPPVIPGRKLIKISGKKLPPPPRKVVIERLAPLPPKPQSVIIERWLPYQENLKRKVIFQRAPPDPVLMKPKNLIIQWEPPNIIVKKNLKYLGTIKADPIEYIRRYGGTLKTSDDLPQFVKDIKTPEGLVLATDYTPSNQVHELIGDVEALKLVDLESEGLSEYKHQLEKYMLENASPNTTTSFNNSNTNVIQPASSSGTISSNSGSSSATCNLNNNSSSNNNNNNGSMPQVLTTNNNYKSSDEEAEKILSRLNSRLRDSNGRRLIVDPNFYYLV
jgi:hypothetical protein